MAEAEVQIDASRGSLTIKGEQEFVAETLEKYKFVFEHAPKMASKPATDSTKPDPAARAADAGALAAYSNVYDVEGDVVSILVTPPGKNMTAQAKACILLFLFARYKLGAEPTPADAIKEQCKAHACFDPKNFASHLKGQKNLITVTGSNSTMAARLTVPGRKAGEEMVQSLQGDE